MRCLHDFQSLATAAGSLGGTAISSISFGASDRRVILKYRRNLRGGSHSAATLQSLQFPYINAISPVLHHLPALLHVLSMVVGIRVGMRKLTLYPIVVRSEFVERGIDGGAYAVSGQLVLITHPFQGTVKRVLADPLGEITAMCKQETLGRFHGIQ